MLEQSKMAIIEADAEVIRDNTDARMSEVLATLWEDGHYEFVKRTLTEIYQPSSTRWRQGIADRLQGAKRESFLIYMAM